MVVVRKSAKYLKETILQVFKRKIMLELDAWKASLPNKKKALVVKGLRQIGKTFIVQQFAKQNYENVILLDFKKNASPISTLLRRLICMQPTHSSIGGPRKICHINVKYMSYIKLIILNSKIVQVFVILYP